MIFSGVLPMTKASIFGLKNKLSNTTTANYKVDISEMLDEIEVTYGKILQKGDTHDNYLINNFKDLKISENSEFDSFI